MVDLTGFNANDHEPAREYEALPQGKYHAELISSELKDVGNGDKGTKIALTWRIISGPAEGRLVFQDILNGYNVQGEKGDQTRDIASRQLSAICLAVGKPSPRSSEELHHIPCELSVGFGKQNTNPQTGEPYPLRNEVKGVMAWGGAASQPASRAPAQSNNAAPASRPAAASGGGGWARRA